MAIYNVLETDRRFQTAVVLEGERIVKNQNTIDQINEMAKSERVKLYWGIIKDYATCGGKLSNGYMSAERKEMVRPIIDMHRRYRERNSIVKFAA